VLLNMIEVQLSAKSQAACTPGGTEASIRCLYYLRSHDF